MSENQKAALTPDQEGWMPCQYSWMTKDDDPNGYQRPYEVLVNAWYKAPSTHGKSFPVRIYIHDLPVSDQNRLNKEYSRTNWLETFATDAELKFPIPPGYTDVLPFDDLEHT